MSRLRNIYLYLVSFVSLMMVIIGIIFAVQNFTDVLFPTNYYYQSIPYKNGELTPEEIKMQEENQKMELEMRDLERKKDVAKSISVVLISLPVFMYHWRKIEKEKGDQKA